MLTRVLVLSAVLASGVATAHALNLTASRGSGSAALAAANAKLDGREGDGEDEMPDAGTFALLAVGLVGAVGLVRVLKTK